MADDTTEDTTFDLSTLVPEQFKGEDGNYDTDAFRASFDDLAAFRSQEDERVASLPKEAGEYGFSIPEGHQWPEGFDPKQLMAKDAEGNDVDFDPMSLFDGDDPDIPALQAILLNHKAAPGMMGEIASVVANREIRAMQKGMAEAEAQKKALGPQADARIATVTRELKSRLPEPQVAAILDSVTSADALRGLEQLMKNSKPPVNPAPQGQDISSMSITERIALGLQQRKRA